MKLIHRLYVIFRNLIHRSHVDAEDTEEIQAYLGLLADEFADSGMSRPEAERKARIQCGGEAQLVQSIRELRSGIQIDMLWQDFRFAVRQFRRQSLFTLTSLATLAVGMGATIAIFSSVYSLILRPLRVADPNRLVTLAIQFRNGESNNMFAPDFAAMRSGAIHSFEQTAGYVIHNDVNLTGGRVPQRLSCMGITSNLMATLGVHPQLGRDIAEAEDVPASAPVVLVSDRLWRSQFGADRELLGKSIMLDGEPRTVIGVLPLGFAFPDPTIEPDIYMPASLPTTTVFSNKPASPVSVIARLHKGVDRAVADVEAKEFYRERVQLYPAGWGSGTLSLISLQEHVSGDFRTPLLLLTCCVFCVLMVTCANVSSLQLARAASRSQEILVREALGASRARLIRQFLVENLVLSLMASLLGFVLAWFSIKLIQASEILAAHPIATSYGAPAFTGVFGKYGSTIHMNGVVLLFSVTLPLITTVLFGILPAIHAARSRSLRIFPFGAGQITAGISRRRFGRILLVFELASSITLLFCAGLLIKSFGNMMSFESGFDPSNVMTASTQLTGDRYQAEGLLTGQNADAVDRFTREVLRRLSAVSGVKAAAFTNVLPLDSTAKIQFSLDGASNPTLDLGHFVAFIAISPDYFQVVGTPILKGRAFQQDDTTTSPRVLVVNRNLASRFFGGNALGKQLYIRELDGSKRTFVWATIVGVAENVPHGGFLRPSEPEIYLPLSQAPQSNLEIAVRSAGTPTLLTSGIVRSVADSDPDIPVSNLEMMEDRILHRVALRKTLMALMSGFAVLATLLSAIGVGGMFAYMVAQRTREMGIRLALGASQANLIRIVIGEVWVIVNFGCLFGMLTAISVGRSMSSMLVGVGQYDPKVLMESLALVTAAAVLAASLPAFHASRSDVLAVLREE
jgi:putative ABC transport system permease protein